MTYSELKPPKAPTPKESWQLRSEYERKKREFFDRAMKEWRSEQKSRLKMLTSKDVCSIFQITERTLLRWRRVGKMPYYNINGSIRYSAKEISDYVKKLKCSQQSSTSSE